MTKVSENSELKKSEPTNLINFSTDQVNLIKSLIAKDCSNDELQLFLYQCKRTGLDPLTRQIYCIKRAGRMTIQTSIDGFRVIAERSGTYAGQDEPAWVDDEKGFPVKCTVKVYRFAPSGERYPAGVGVAYFKEYYPAPMNLQKTMPHTMIAKVAEALALRKAYPQDLSGLYTTEEIEPQETHVIKPQAAKPQVDVREIPPQHPKKKAETIEQVLTEEQEHHLADTLLAVAEAQTKDDLMDWAKLQKEWVKINAKFRDAVLQKSRELAAVNKHAVADVVPETQAALPWLSAEEFKAVKNRIDAGNLSALDETIAKCRIKNIHLTALQEAHDFSLKVAR